MVNRSDSRIERVLLTGLDGFTGRHLAVELRTASYTVQGLTATDGSSVDLLDAAAVLDVVREYQPQAVIHLAAQSFAGHGDIEAIYRTNIVGTRNLLLALASLAQKPQTVLLASTAHVYGNALAHDAVLSEGAALRPSNDYAVSKLAMEYMARTWSAQLPINFMRAFNYTGVGQDVHFLVPKIVDHFRRRERRIELGNLDVWREFNDVRMVAWIYRRMLETRGEHDTYNLCSGRVHSLREILASMALIAGYEIEVDVNPNFVRKNEIVRLAGDPSRLRQRVGYSSEYSLDETLRWMYEAQ